MSDHIARAAQVIHAQQCSSACASGPLTPHWEAAQALDTAGLLASPAHDAAVAARALREAAKDTLYGHDAVGLRRRADWVEREGGAS